MVAKIIVNQLQRSKVLISGVKVTISGDYNSVVIGQSAIASVVRVVAWLASTIVYHVKS